MIMVRRNELACRDEWSRSLWTPTGNASEVDEPFQRPNTLGPAAPANMQDMRSLVNANTTVPATPVEGEDVLLSEGRIISELHERPVKPERPAASAGFDPRTAVIKAREAYRERTRAKEAAARQQAGAEAIVVPRQETPTPRLRAEEPTPTSRSTRLRESHQMPAPTDSLSRHSSPVVDDIRTETAAAPQRPDFHEPAIAVVTRNGSDQPAFGSRSIAASSPQSDFSADATRTPSQQVESAKSEMPDWFRADLPRICRTCRDFRPSAEGDRGWCANAWAFTHRRLVHEDDPAPCDSSIGDWWAPVDDIWLVAADVSSHGRATPLLDRASGQEPGRRRRS
jgi:hypothetical protein